MDSEKWKTLHEKAKKKSREEFTEAASDICNLTKDEVDSVIKDADVNHEKFSELMSIVGDATKDNKKKAEAIRTGTGLAEVAASLIGKLI